MELKDTITLMTSEDYRERLVAEYRQLCIRETKLGMMLSDYDDGRLDFEPMCSTDLLRWQLSAMDAYRKALERRAEVEGIEL